MTHLGALGAASVVTLAWVLVIVEGVRRVRVRRQSTVERLSPLPVASGREPAHAGSRVRRVLVERPARSVVSDIGPRLRTSARRRRRELEELDALSEWIDLVALSCAAGSTVATAVERATTAMSWAAPLGRELRRQPSIDRALDVWGAEGGDDRRALSALINVSLVSGSALSERLSNRSDSLRSRRRHEALAAARRLPVRLLVPLVVCALPSFVALSVVPLLVVSLQSLSWEP